MNGPQRYQPDPAEEFAQQCMAERDHFRDRCNLLDEALAKVHAEAMWHAQTGDNLRKQGCDKVAHMHYWMALSIDRAIADSLPAIPGENGKAILCKSAAVLAMNCGFFQEAFEFANKGLACVNCPVIKAELEEVRDDARERKTIGYR